jgi:hypothetical protein
MPILPWKKKECYESIPQTDSRIPLANINLNLFDGVSQDAEQFIESIGYFGMQVIQCFAGTMLMFAVPHTVKMDTLRYVAVAMNVVSLSLTLVFLIVEMRREILLIQMLEENPKKSSDPESVAKALLVVDKSNRSRLFTWQAIYKYFCYVVCSICSVNTLYSMYVICSHHSHGTEFGTDAQTIGVFATNTSFLFSKLGISLWVAVQGDYIFLSAYLKKQVQYNDFDPDSFHEKLQTPSHKLFRRKHKQ